MYEMQLWLYFQIWVISYRQCLRVWIEDLSLTDSQNGTSATYDATQYWGLLIITLGFHFVCLSLFFKP